MTQQRWHLRLIIVFMFIVTVPVFAQFHGSEIKLSTFTNTNFNIRGMRPQGWDERVPNSGVYRRGADPLDRTALLIQSSSGTSSEVLASLLSQYRLSSSPTLEDRIATSALTWSTYTFESDIGTQTLYVDIALAEQGSTVYMVLMQTIQLYYDQLHQDVFLTVLGTVAPIESAGILVDVVTNTDDATSRPEWTITGTRDISTWHSADDSVRVHFGTVATDDGEAAINNMIAQMLPDDAIAYAADAVTMIESDEEIILLIDFHGTAGIVRGMARIVDGVANVTILDSTSDGLQAYHDDLEIIVGDVMLDGLIVRDETSAESTPEAEVTPEMTAEATEEQP